MGTPTGKKQQDTIQLVLQNVDGIPNNTKGEIKLDCLYTFMVEHEIDIPALTELNMAWDCLEYKDCLPAKTCRWWEASQWSMAHNKQDTHGDDFQPGGTAIVTMKKLSHKMTKPSDNTSGLGRWCWMRLWGKRIISSTLFHCIGHANPRATLQRTDSRSGGSHGKRKMCGPETKYYLT